MMLLLLCCFCAPAWIGPASGAELLGGGVPQFNTGEERIGELHLGMQEKAVHANIPCKPRKGREIFEAATGDHVQMWEYRECGIELKMSSEHKGAPKMVASITIWSPSKLVTSRGIHIGSTEAEVVEAYGPYRDEDSGTENARDFIAGSIYGGMIFRFKDGRVDSIFLGAAAE